MALILTKKYLISTYIFWCSQNEEMGLLWCSLYNTIGFHLSGVWRATKLIHLEIHEIDVQLNQ